mgnify:CR=1 FL=1
MSILSDSILDEIKEIVKREVRNEENQVKIDDAKIIVQVLLPEVDRIITAKMNKMFRKIAVEIISWDLIEEIKEESVKTDDASILDQQSKGESS